MQELWNWYSSLFTSSKNLEVIGVWTATITTASFLINFVVIPFFNFVKNSFANLKVEATVKLNFSMASVIGNKYLAPSLFCKVTNKSEKAIFIKAPIIKLSKKVYDSKEFHVPAPSDKYPKKLEPGEQFREEYNASELDDSLFEQISDKDTIRFKIQTTKGKKYYSNKIKKKNITSNIELSKASIDALNED